MIISAQNVP